MIRINLLPREERGKSQSRVDKLRAAAIVAWGLTALLVLVTIFNVRIAALYRSELQALTPRMEQLEVFQRDLREVRRHNEALQNDIDVLGDFFATEDNSALVQIVEDIAAALPDTVWLRRVAVTPGEHIRVDGYTGHADDLSRLLRSLRQMRGVSDVELASMTRMGDEEPYLRAFTVQMIVGGTPL